MSARLDAALAELAAALRAEIAPTPAGPDRLLSVGEAGAMLGLGRTRIYAELNVGRLRSVSSGRRRLVPASAIAEFIAAQSRDL